VSAKLSLLPRAVPAKREQKVSSGRHIAIVDDDESVRRAFARLIRAYSFQVQTYGSGREFLDSLSTSVPACLIVDVHMEDMSGFELLLRLAAMGLKIPAVVVTARDEQEVRRDCELCGAAALLIKPIEGPSLLKAINTAMSTPAGRDVKGQ
jgi:FixJ family two-component response regulator